MISAQDSLAQRLEEVRGRIERSALRSGRSAAEVRLVAAVKNVPDDQVAAALALGIAELGENRVQEARARRERIGRGTARWHMIGHLQRNKAGQAIELFDRVHSVDDAELAQALSRRAAAAGRRLPVLIEVNIAAEPGKHGVATAQAGALAETMEGLPALALDGLMTVGPADDAAAARRGFAALRELRDALQRTLGRPLPELSMGMSGDFEAAIEEGSTMVRIGTALFGARPAH